LKAALDGLTKDMQGNRRAGFTVETAINRKDFDLNWNVALETGGVLVSEKVNIMVDAQIIERVPVTA
jgi:polyisoprenoid-binding protein YceI